MHSVTYELVKYRMLPFANCLLLSPEKFSNKSCTRNCSLFVCFVLFVRGIEGTKYNGGYEKKLPKLSDFYHFFLDWGRGDSLQQGVGRVSHVTVYKLATHKHEK